MPPTVSYPGVYIQEIPSGVQTITGVATSIAAFIGWAPMGPTNEATLVLSWQDYVNQFGGLDSRSFLGYAVNEFFINGGQQAYIVRLAADGTNATTAATPATVTLTSLTFDTTTTPTSTVTAGLAANDTGGGLAVTAANPGLWTNNYGIMIQPRLDDYTRFSLSVIFIPGTSPTTVDLTKQANFTVVESFQNLSLDPNDALSRYAVNVVNNGSNFIKLAMGTPALTLTHNPTTIPATLPPPGFLAISLAKSPGLPGADGTVFAPGTVSGSTTVFETFLNAGGTLAGGGGVHLLDNVDLFNLLCVPGEVDAATISLLQAYCVGKRAFYIVDSAQTDTITSVQANLGTMGGSNSINSALYFPWVSAPDPQNENRARAFPPSGFVAGIYAATDSSRGVWKAPAGINASLTGSVGLLINLTDPDNGVLNPVAVNCLRNFSSFGNVVWGARTLNGNDNAGSEWKYVPVRRTALFIEESLFRGTKFAVFEPNAEPLWSELRLAVTTFMQGLFRQGAFQGQTAAEAFFVKCDSQTTTQADINLGIVNIQVGFAPLKPAEFVVISIQQLAGQA